MDLGVALLNESSLPHFVVSGYVEYIPDPSVPALYWGVYLCFVCRYSLLSLGVFFVVVYVLNGVAGRNDVCRGRIDECLQAVFER